MGYCLACWAEALLKIARMTLTIKRDGNWSSFQLANSALPLSVTSSAIAPSARMDTSACSQAYVPSRMCAPVFQFTLIFKISCTDRQSAPGPNNLTSQPQPVAPLRNLVTPKGVPHLALCGARATREGPWSKLKEPLPRRKIGVTSKTPVGVISVVTLIRTDTTLDHSQKAEKV